MCRRLLQTNWGEFLYSVLVYIYCIHIATIFCQAVCVLSVLLCVELLKDTGLSRTYAALHSTQKGKMSHFWLQFHGNMNCFHGSTLLKGWRDNQMVFVLSVIDHHNVNISPAASRRTLALQTLLMWPERFTALCMCSRWESGHRRYNTTPHKIQQ